MRVICLVDCDSFYVSCEQRDNPIYRNKPVCVLTGAGARGIVVSRSKEAKERGIPMGAPLFMIKDAGNDVIYLPARMDRYVEISNRVMNCLKTFSPQVEVVSVDEAYIDLTSLNKLHHKTYVEIVRIIRQAVWDKTGIPVSIGLSTSKTLAKLASDKAKKTGGIFCISPKRVEQIIGDLAIEDICGIGKRTALHLKTNGIFTVSEFLQRPDGWIRQVLGKNGLELKYELSGQMVSPVNPLPQPPQSIRHSSVIGDFSSDKNLITNELHYHIHQACRKLRENGAFCQEIGVMLRLKSFQTVVEKQKLFRPTQSEQDIGRVATHLLDDLFQANTLYTSVGIELEGLRYDLEKEADLFDTAIHPDTLGQTVDTLEQKFGKNIIQIGWYTRQSSDNKKIVSKT